MAIAFDNKVSVMDAVSITFGLLCGAYAFFGVGAHNDLQDREIDYLKASQVKLESRQSEQANSISVKLEKIREEQKADNRRIELKIDRLIERELEK